MLCHTKGSQRGRFTKRELGALAWVWGEQKLQCWRRRRRTFEVVHEILVSSPLCTSVPCSAATSASSHASGAPGPPARACRRSAASTAPSVRCRKTRAALAVASDAVPSPGGSFCAQA